MYVPVVSSFFFSSLLFCQRYSPLCFGSPPFVWIYFLERHLERNKNPENVCLKIKISGGQLHNCMVFLLNEHLPEWIFILVWTFLINLKLLMWTILFLHIQRNSHLFKYHLFFFYIDSKKIPFNNIFFMIHSFKDYGGIWQKYVD